MEPKNEPKSYNYTLYNSYNNQDSTLYKPTCPPLSEVSSSETRVGHFTTIHSPNFAQSNPETSPYNYQEPLIKGTPYRPPVRPAEEKTSTQKPLTFPYKNPNCGISISGKTGFEIKGDYASIKIQKVLNARQGGKSGTLRLHLIRMPYFYDGGSGIKPEEYTSVCTANLGQLDGGWSFNDIVRGNMKRIDDTKECSYRKCYVLLLEEYSEGNFRIVEYMNFD